MAAGVAVASAVGDGTATTIGVDVSVVCGTVGAMDAHVRDLLVAIADAEVMSPELGAVVADAAARDQRVRWAVAKRPFPLPGDERMLATSAGAAVWVHRPDRVPGDLADVWGRGLVRGTARAALLRAAGERVKETSWRSTPTSTWHPAPLRPLMEMVLDSAPASVVAVAGPLVQPGTSLADRWLLSVLTRPVSVSADVHKEMEITALAVVEAGVSADTARALLSPADDARWPFPPRGATLERLLWSVVLEDPAGAVLDGDVVVGLLDRLVTARRPSGDGVRAVLQAPGVPWDIGSVPAVVSLLWILCPDGAQGRAWPLVERLRQAYPAVQTYPGEPVGSWLVTPDGGRVVDFDGLVDAHRRPAMYGAAAQRTATSIDAVAATSGAAPAAVVDLLATLLASDGTPWSPFDGVPDDVVQAAAAVL